MAEAVAKCRFPVHAIMGDHDVVLKSLEGFGAHLSAASNRSFVCDGYRLLLLDSVAEWQGLVFGLGEKHMKWLGDELLQASERRQTPSVFMHAYASEHGADAEASWRMFEELGVLLVQSIRQAVDIMGSQLGLNENGHLWA